MDEKDLEKTAFSKESFWDKLAKDARKMGANVVYPALLLYYTFMDENTPIAAKATIAAALVYLITPIDFLPDMVPGGFIDDAGAITVALKTVDAYVTPAIKAKAKEKSQALFER